MRVLMISHTCQSPTEGQPKAERLAQLPDVELRVLVPDRWRHYSQWRPARIGVNAVCRYEVGRVACPWIGPAQNYLHWYPGLARLLRAFRPDIIDLWEEPWGLVSAHACWLRQRLLPQAKVIAETEQNIDKTLPPPFEALRAYTLRHADYVVGRSPEALEVARAKGYKGEAVVVPNGVDTTLFQPLDRSVCRAALSLSGFVAGYVGRLVEEKGLADMVDALAFCPGEVTLLFVGDGPYRATLEQRAREQGTSARIRFLPAQPLEQLPTVMNALDTLVLASRTTSRWKEQFGRVLIEAQACQTPVIGSASGAIPGVIGAAGLIVPEQAPQALALAITRLAADAELCRRLGKSGRLQVEQRCAWPQVAQQMRAIYLQVVQTLPTTSPPQSLS